MIPSVRLWAGALAVLAGCRSVPSREPTCEPASGPLPATADAATLAGEYRLRMERPGNSAPTVVVGSLTLVTTDDSLRYGLTRGGNIDSSIVQPLHGTTDIDLEAVGALTAGDTRSTEPRWPGVLVVQWPAPPSGTQIVLRLGAERNQRGSQVIDAAYTVLRVGRIDSAGFAGTWESGHEGRVVSGQFCAVRRAP